MTHKLVGIHFCIIYLYKGFFHKCFFTKRYNGKIDVWRSVRRHLSRHWLLFHFSLRFLYFTLFRKLLLLTYIIINHFLFTQTNTDLSSKHKQYFPIAQLLFLTAKVFTTISSAKPASFLYLVKLVLYFTHKLQFIHYVSINKNYQIGQTKKQKNAHRKYV